MLWACSAMLQYESWIRILRLGKSWLHTEDVVLRFQSHVAVGRVLCWNVSEACHRLFDFYSFLLGEVSQEMLALAFDACWDRHLVLIATSTIT